LRVTGQRLEGMFSDIFVGYSIERVAVVFANQIAHTDSNQIRRLAWCVAYESTFLHNKGIWPMTVITNIGISSASMLTLTVGCSYSL
jgi:hypothetical protein